MISVKGLKRKLFPYQAYAVYWMLKKERTEAGGGFLADEQGLGKTTVSIVLCIVSRMLLDARDSVNSSITASNKRGTVNADHLINDKTQVAGAVCPSEARGETPFGIACPCSRSSPSFNLVPKAGAVLIVAPADLLRVWRSEFDNIIAKDKSNPAMNAHGMTLEIAHGLFVKDLNKDVFQRDGRAARKLKDHSKVIILTTSGSFKNHVLDKLDQPITAPEYKYNNKINKAENAKAEKDAENKFNKANAEANKGKKVINWGRVIVDEFHKEKSVKTRVVRFTKKLAGWPFVWGLSGTPFEATPRDLKGFIGTLEAIDKARREKKKTDRQSWDQSDLKYGKEKAFTTIINDYEGVVNNKLTQHYRRQARDRIKNQFGPLLRVLVLRRTLKSTWFGEFMATLKPHLPRNQGAKAKDEWAEDLNALRAFTEKQLQDAEKARQKLRKRVAKDDEDDEEAEELKTRDIKTVLKIRIAVTFPEIARILMKQATGKMPMSDWKLTGEELNKQGWYNETGGKLHISSQAVPLSGCLIFLYTQ